MKTNTIQNNVSPLPFFYTKEERAWNVFKSGYKLYVPNQYFIPFIFRANNIGHIKGDFTPEDYNKDFLVDASLIPFNLSLYSALDDKFICDMLNVLSTSDFMYKIEVDEDVDQEVYIFFLAKTLLDFDCYGDHYLVLETPIEKVYSEVFTLVGNTSNLFEFHWGGNIDVFPEIEDFVPPNVINDSKKRKVKLGIGDVNDFQWIYYADGSFGMPRYSYEEENISRDGYLYQTKQISKKIYTFKMLAPESICDLFRFVRLADYAFIIADGKKYIISDFLPTVSWQSNGYLAEVTCEFISETIYKKIPNMLEPPTYTGEDVINELNKKNG